MSEMIKVGETIVFTAGEPYEYWFQGPMKVLKEFKKEEVSKEFISQWPPKDRYPRRPSESGFIDWMVSNGYVEISAHHRWYVGSDGFKPDAEDPCR